MSYTQEPPFSQWQKQCQKRVFTTLDKHLPQRPNQTQLLEAMRYSTLSPGKRLRPCLVYASAELLHIKSDIADMLAAIIEIVHVYSLIHDDLPAMDDDDLRRGKPACHKKYPESIAILAGDALQVLAFEWLCTLQELHVKASIVVHLCATLSKAIGALGMAQGQALDLCWSYAPWKKVELADVQEIHRLKTGQLFCACIDMCLIVSEQQSLSVALKKFAHHIGIAFQVQDDILDITGNQEIIGKQLGSDEKAKKITYPSLVGLEQSYQQRDYHYQQAIKCLDICEQMMHSKNNHYPNNRLKQVAKNMIYPEIDQDL